MENLRLTIDLLPRGAWGNNLSKTLSKADWDVLRNAYYRRASDRCEICGKGETSLHAHEVWDFDIQQRTQTLVNIIALCPGCHGVKHMRNSERIGLGEQAKAHFLRINGCDELKFAGHYLQAQLLFNERNQVERWKVIADLDSFGGRGMKVRQREIPRILSPYEGREWTAGGAKTFFTVVKGEEFASRLEPKVRSIQVDPYEGTITVIADYADKIQWLCDGKLLRTKYNTVGKFITTFHAENLAGDLRFRVTGPGGETISQPFRLVKEIC